MAKQENAPGNREVVAATALALVFGAISAPIVQADFATKTGAVTYASVRKSLRDKEPNLTGDALTQRVNEIVGQRDSTALAAVIQMNREGFHFTRMNGRELKNGTKNVSIAMTNRNDTGAVKAKKIEDYTVAELMALAEARQAKDQGAKVVEIEATTVAA